MSAAGKIKVRGRALDLIEAIHAVCTTKIHPQANRALTPLVAKYHENDAFRAAYNITKQSWDYAETIENVADAIGQEDCHWLTLSASVKQALETAARTGKVPIDPAADHLVTDHPDDVPAT